MEAFAEDLYFMLVPFPNEEEKAPLFCQFEESGILESVKWLIDRCARTMIYFFFLSLEKYALENMGRALSSQK